MAVPQSTSVVARPSAGAREAARVRFPLGRLLTYAGLTVGCCLTLAPFLWMLGTSFKSSTEIIRLPPTLVPEHPTLQSYRTIITDPRVPLARFYFNSAFVTTLVVAMVLFTLTLATMMIPFQVTMIPAYLILTRLHLTDSLWGLIVPGATSAFGIFLMKQFIEGIPSELIDAARIDGASEFGIYTRIVLPQMGAALATLGIFQFMATWNDYLWPLIVITTTEKRTLPIMLTWYNSQHGARHDLSMAASVLVILPITVVYFLFQRWIVQGVALTGFK